MDFVHGVYALADGVGEFLMPVKKSIMCMAFREPIISGVMGGLCFRAQRRMDICRRSRWRRL